jgi:thiamine biosynthesis lipoprotein
VTPVPAVRDRVLGTEVLVAGVPSAAQAAALAALHRVEAVFSRFRPGSDLCRVNAAGGVPVRVAPVFAAALADACAHAAATGGVFSPLLGREVAATGYAVDLAEVPGRPSAAPPPAVTAPRVRIDHGSGTVAVPPGVALDLGGFVKGWAVQRVADELRAGGAPRGLVDAGGDVACWTDGEPWRVGVARPGTDARVLRLHGRAAVATGSTAHRAWRDADGAPQHHVIDPRTGRPCRSGWVRVTTWQAGEGADLGALEAAATALLVLGPEQGPPLLAARYPDASWLAVDPAGATTTGGVR